MIFITCFMHLFLLSFSSASYRFFSSEVFVLPLSAANFSMSSSDIEYRPSLLNLPDLPRWLLYTYSSTTQMGYLYGAPPSGQGNFNLEVLATDKSTYNTSRAVFNINVLEDNSKRYEIHFKLSNFNIDELLIGGRLERLKAVIVNYLWSDSNGVFTSLLPASLKGDRLPLNPSDREGVYVSYGSTMPFSYSLHELEMEVKPLWNHQPCPKYFKKASYERYFRIQGFAVDWCSFKLEEMLEHDNEKPIEIPSYSYIQKSHPQRVVLTNKSDVVTRSYVLDVINTLLVPILVMLVLLALLSLAMCCHRSDMIPTMHDIQMVHYPRFPKPTALNRRSTKGESPHPSLTTTTTHIDTLPRSQTTSPISTLNRTTPSRRFEDYETLSRPDPPPYQRKNGTEM